jgi:hypothetical protein
MHPILENKYSGFFSSGFDTIAAVVSFNFLAAAPS